MLVKRKKIKKLYYDAKTAPVSSEFQKYPHATLKDRNSTIYYYCPYFKFLDPIYCEAVTKNSSNHYQKYSARNAFRALKITLLLFSAKNIHSHRIQIDQEI